MTALADQYHRQLIVERLRSRQTFLVLDVYGYLLECELSPEAAIAALEAFVDDAIEFKRQQSRER
jgi:hypothetical protein